MPELAEELFFNFNGAVVGGEDFDFVVFELGGSEALGVDQGLLTFVVGGRVGQVGLTDFNVIPKDGVIADFERSYAGAGALSFFDGGDRLAAGAADGS